MLRVMSRGEIWRERVQSLPLDALWIDLVSPDHSEVSMAEAALGVDIPTLSEMQEIVPSRCFHEEQGALYATLLVPVEEGGLKIKLVPVTCVLARGILLSIRHHPIPTIDSYIDHAKHSDISSLKASLLFVRFVTLLLDAIADLLKRITGKVDLLSHDIFQREAQSFTTPRTASISLLLQRIGLCGETTACLRDSLIGFELLIAFMTSVQSFSEDIALKSLDKDIRALRDLVTFLSGKVSFLLNATLGLVNLRQNDIIKIFSVVSVVFLPPTLLTGLWGMNFRFMPELLFPWSYPIALLVILASAATPYLFCKKRGWL